MKRWTVMMIPHDKGGTHTLKLSAWQLWIGALFLILASFISSFLIGRYDTKNRLQAARLDDVRKELAQRASQPAATRTNAIAMDERLEIEQRVRAEYEASLSAITSKLNELNELESEARSLTGLSSERATSVTSSGSADEGKGGAYSPGLGQLAYPQSMGMYSTTTGGTVSADLLVQEIAARKIGLARLIKQVRNHQDEVARIPSAWPLTSRARQISSSFGYRKDPFTYRVSFHSGLDLRGPVGLPVLATAKGQVTYSGYDGEWGNIVRVDHGNGIVTFYAHLSHTRVKVGAVVERGETVGTLGNTGRSTGSHLHYEIIVSGRSVDPEKYL